MTIVCAAFQYSLPILKIYSARNVHCRFSILVNNEYQNAVYIISF